MGGVAVAGLGVAVTASNADPTSTESIKQQLDALDKRVTQMESQQASNAKKPLTEPGTGLIISLGEALIDFLPRPLQGEVGYLPRCGGAPFNVCLTTARLGAPTAFLSHISSDLFGDKICNLLAENGVNLDLVKRVPQPTTLAFVDLQGDEPQYAFFFENAADRTLTPELLPAIPPTTEAIHLSMGAITLEAQVSGAFRTLLAREKDRVFTSFDPNIRDMMIPDATKYRSVVLQDIALFHLVKVSKADLEYLYGIPNLSQSQLDEIAKDWLSKGPSVVLITQGGESILAYRPSSSFSVGLTPVKVKDAVGAGDSFMGAMLVALRKRGGLVPGALSQVSDADLRSDMQFAARVAATTCTREGADPPSAQEMGWENKRE